jgi:hypothetical protein
MSRPRSVRRAQPAAHTAPPTAAATHRRRARHACFLGVFCFVVYLTNLRPMAAGDSIPARLLPFSILRERNLDLNEFPWLRRVRATPYFMHQTRDGRWLSSYPNITALLITPLWLPAVWWLQRHHIEDDDVRFRLVSVVMERGAAALITALSVVLLFLAAAAITTPELAMAISLVYAFGTNTWATSSQALWQHGFAELSLAGMSLFLLSADTWRTAIAAGGFAALAVAGRPTMGIFTLLTVIFMWRERRQRLWAFLTLPVIGMAVLLGSDPRRVFETRAAFRHAALELPDPVHLAALLFSPNRGLLVYAPAAVLAAGAWYATPQARRWLTYLAIGIVGYVLLYSGWSGWWGGFCYGPRFLTDALPAIALCAVPAVERLWRLRWGRLALAALAGWGVVVQVIGVYYDDRSWNQYPKSVNLVPQRVWDWRDPQIVRAARAGWHGTDLAPLLWQALTDARPGLLKPLTPAGLAGTITTDAPLPLRYRSNSAGRLTIRVTNQSGEIWPAFSDFGLLQVGLVERWWLAGVMVTGVGGVVPLPRNLGVGESTRTCIRIETPTQPGTYELELLVVQETQPSEGISGGAVLRLPAHIE